jgi:hypothetical protein
MMKERVIFIALQTSDIPQPTTVSEADVRDSLSDDEAQGSVGMDFVDPSPLTFPGDGSF